MKPRFLKCECKSSSLRVVSCNSYALQVNLILIEAVDSLPAPSAKKQLIMAIVHLNVAINAH